MTFYYHWQLYRAIAKLRKRVWPVMSDDERDELESRWWF